MQGHQLGGADLRGHVGELEGDALVGADGLAELLAVGGPLQRQVQRALGLADAVGGDHHAAGGEPGVGHFPALVDFAEDLGGRHAAVVEEDLVGVVALVADALGSTAHGHARGALVHQEGGHRVALLAVVLIGVGDGEDDGEVGMAGMADEVLAAVQHEVVAVAHGAGLDGVGVGAGARFGEGEAVDLLALHAGQQVILDLLALAGHEDLRGPRDEHVQRPGDLRQLALDQRLGQIVEAATTDFLGHVEGIEAGRDGLAANLRGELRGHGVGAVHFFLIGQQFLLDEALHRLDEHFLFLGQFEIHGGHLPALSGL
ncbi:hypothetical protein D9M69_422420 [compost metagenome]